MKFFTKLSLLLVFLAFSVSAFAGIPPQGVNLTKTATGYTIDFRLPSYDMNEVKVNGESFFRVNSGEYGITNEVGNPMLPQVSFFLLISKSETNPTFSVASQNSDLKNLQWKVYPTQAPWEKNKPLEERPFTINREYYNTNGSIDNPFVKISEPFIVGGAKGVMITVYPFAYNPSQNILKVTNSARININLKSEPALNFLPGMANNELFNSMFVNYTPAKNLGTNNYLIITAPAYQSSLSTFVTHKTSMGYNVYVAPTTETGTTNTAILAYIQARYNNTSTKPEFVLLVGDIADIPHWVGIGSDNPPTDLNYSLLEGSDAFADVAIGRFPVQNATQLTNMITKSIYMENMINGAPKKAIFMASTDNYAITEATHNFCIDSFFTPGNGYAIRKLYTHTYSATTTQLIQALDSSKLWAIYSGHGGYTSWADGPPLSITQVYALTNNYMYPFVYSFACQTGNFAYSSEAFCESWLRSSKAGVIFWGSSVNSYWDEDDILQRRLFRAVFTEELIKNTHAFNRAKWYLVQHYGSVTTTMRRYLEMYNSMGDPSIYLMQNGPKISHTPLPNTENLTGPYTVNCNVAPDGSNITGTKLFWTRGTTFDSVTMTNSSGTNWTANIPGNGTTSTYKYFIRSMDALNRVSFLPGNAPANYFTFIASADTSKPVITHSPVPNTPKTIWPVAVTANVTDNIGLDSVWVKWYKNSPSNGVKHLKLNITTGNEYSALFNSNQSEVNFNDSIFYKIYAQDNGSLHKKDSTQLHNFKIIAQTTAIVGTGTTGVGYPYYTFYMDSRTQMLYSATDIIAGNGAPGMINKIGFDITTAASQVMDGFKIKMQNTTSSTISSFVSSGFTTVYDSSYAVPGTGWQYVNLQTPFYWNGTGNLLIEICFNNSNYTSNTTVNGTPASGLVAHNHSDLSSGDGCTAITTVGSTYTTRPNIALMINLITNEEKNITSVPDKYSLAQNYPNPFNPVTSIKYQIPKNTFVTIKIYDILGKEVRTLVNEVKSAGNYSVMFDASSLSSGVYFYKISAGEFSDVKRMVLIK